MIGTTRRSEFPSLPLRRNGKKFTMGTYEDDRSIDRSTDTVLVVVVVVGSSGGCRRYQREKVLLHNNHWYSTSLAFLDGYGWIWVASASLLVLDRFPSSSSKSSKQQLKKEKHKCCMPPPRSTHHARSFVDLY